jgi:hypothetical protein
MWSGVVIPEQESVFEANQISSGQQQNNPSLSPANPPVVSFMLRRVRQSVFE